MGTRTNRRLTRGSFLHNVSILTGGTVFAQALLALSLPIQTRLYSPEDFNLLAVYVGIIGIVTVVSSLRYNVAIPLPEADTDGLALLAISLLVACGLSVICALPVLVAPEETVVLLGQPGLKPYLWMIPVGVFIASAYNALQYWASRKKRFGLVTRTRMTRAVGGVGSQLGIGAFHPTPLGLIFGHMVYGGLGIVGLIRSLLKEDSALLGAVSKTSMALCAHTYRRFPIYSVPESLFNTAGVQLPLILIAATVAGPEAGFLFLAMRVLGLPMGLIGSSVSQVFLAEAPEKLRDGTLAEFTLGTMRTLLFSGGPALLAVAAVSPIAFPLAFGAEWSRAGWLLVWATPWFILQFVASPVSMVLLVTGRFRQAVLLQGAGLVLRAGSVAIAGALASDFVSETFAASGAIFYGLYIYVIIKMLREMEEKSSQ